MRRDIYLGAGTRKMVRGASVPCLLSINLQGHGPYLYYIRGEKATLLFILLNFPYEVKAFVWFVAKLSVLSRMHI